MLYKKSQANHEHNEISSSKIVSKLKPECRICFQNDNDGTQQIRAPCRCEGSVKYVHIKCLKKWIEQILSTKKQDQIDQLKQKGIPCQLCKCPIYFDSQLKLYCGSFGENKTRIISKKLFFVLMIMMSMVIVGVIAYCIYQIFYQIQKHQAIKSVKSIMMVTVVGILVILSILLTYFFITEFCLISSNQVGEIRKLVNGKRIKLSSITDQPINQIKIIDMQ